MREALYWSSPGKPVEGTAGCCARAERQRSTTQKNCAALRPRFTIMLFFLATVLEFVASRRGHLPSHSVVIRPSAAFRRNPSNDLIWVSDVASLAVHTVRGVQADALPVGLVGVVDHFVNVGRTEILARAAIFVHAACVADVGVVDDQMRWLIFFMLGARVIKVSELVEGEFAVALRGAEQMRFVASVGGQLGKLLHVLMARGRGIPVAQAASSGELLYAGVEQAGEESVLESLMKVADLPKLIFDPAGFDFLLEAAKHSGGRVLLLECLEGSFSRQHSALDRQMNSFEALRIEETGGIAEDHPAITCNRRNRPPAAIGQGLRTVADHLAALEQFRHKGMLLEILQHVLRIETWVGIIEAGHEAERHDVVPSAIDPRAAILFCRQRPTQRVDDFAGGDAARRDFPQFFYALAVCLRIAVFGKIEFRDQLLGQRPAWAFRQNHHFGL